MKLSDAIDDFLRVKRREGLSHATISNYTRCLRTFSQSVPDSLTAVTRRDFERYLDGYYERGMAKGTIAHHHRILRVFAGWLKEEDLTEANEMARLKAPKLDRTLHANLITRTDFDTLVAGCDAKTIMGRRDRAILHFLYETGVRVGEMCSLKMSDLDLDLGRAKVWGKGSKERFVFFGDKTALAIQRYRMTLKRKGDPVLAFVTLTMEPMTPGITYKMLQRKARFTGVTKDVNPHSFRHAFATEYLRRGGDLNSLRVLLGHSSLAITERYLSLLTDDLAVKHRQFSPLAR